MSPRGPPRTAIVRDLALSHTVITSSRPQVPALPPTDDRTALLSSGGGVVWRVVWRVVSARLRCFPPVPGVLRATRFAHALKGGGQQVRWPRHRRSVMTRRDDAARLSALPRDDAARSSALPRDDNAIAAMRCSRQRCHARASADPARRGAGREACVYASVLAQTRQERSATSG